jgi:hypothetical protein
MTTGHVLTNGLQSQFDAYESMCQIRTQDHDEPDKKCRSCRGTKRELIDGRYVKCADCRGSGVDNEREECEIND